MQQLLIIGYVWPEPTATAAGSRMLQLIRLFQKAHYHVVFACPAQKPVTAFDLASIHVKEVTILLNDDGFNDFIKNLNPTLVMFDRFMMEEQFGWRVAEVCPTALRLLDSEDLHFLRSERLLAVKQNKTLPKGIICSDQAKREIASMYRCDLTFIISEFEMDYLQKTYQIPADLLLYVPFLLEEINGYFTPFEERANLVMIGNFFHAPNRDAVLQLKSIYWPLIRKRLPNCKMLIYGGYPNQQILDLHNEKENFMIKGRAADVNEVMQQAKLCVAPIRFGAGLKGKFIDAMQNGIPLVTTPIGAEGMFGDDDFSESIATSDADFVNKTVQLYTDKSLWLTYQQKGTAVLKSRFTVDLFSENIIHQIQDTHRNLETHRKLNFTGAMLLQQTIQASKYLSKWIIAKNQNL